MAHRSRGTERTGLIREVVDSDEADRFEAYLVEQFMAMTPDQQAQWVGKRRSDRLEAARGA